MWIKYRSRSTGEIKKFNVSKDSIPTLHEEGSEVWDRIVDEFSDSLQLVGYAVLGKDEIESVGQWATYNAEGKEHVNYPPGHPLLFPVDFKKLPIGTTVKLFIPVKK